VVGAIDPGRRPVIDDQGMECTYDNLLLATGGTPRRLPFGGSEVPYFRSFQDYLVLRDLAERRGA
jgi:NADPH-dependent 2,4-dienoyl-CoA reductase/sulfur reductase-like enzyme